MNLSGNGQWLEGPKELWRYRELFYFLALRDLKIRYKQTILGVAWAVIQPIATMLVFTLLFGKVGQMPTDGIPYPLFYFTALLPWIYFSTILPQASNSLLGNVNLLTKIYFPRIILPAATAIVGLLDFLLGSVFLMGLILYYQIVPSWSLLLWPVLIVLLLVLTLGSGLFLASLNVKYRDVKYAVPFIIQLGLFMTPVIYPIGFIPQRFRIWFFLNPLTGIIETFRRILCGQAVDYTLLSCAAMITISIFVLGFLYFNKTQHAFADLI